MSKKIKKRIQRKKPSLAKCANCGKQLHAVPRLLYSQMSKLAKTKKRPQRPYGGYLCSRCMRNLFKKKVFAGMKK